MNETSISWTDYSSNPIRAIRLGDGRKGWFCTRVSEECRNCYASTLNFKFGTGLEFEEENLNRHDFWLDEREFKAWHRVQKPSRVFVVDMTDLFHPAIPGEYVDRVFDEMEKIPRHTFLLLTKRPGLMQRYIARRGRPPDHVWLGTSVGSKRLKPFIDILRNTDAKNRFLSIEPLLEDLGEIDLAGISWAIVGGESGPRHRPMDLDWARSIKKQCEAAGIPFFFKQISGIRPGMQPTALDGQLHWETPFALVHLK